MQKTQQTGTLVPLAQLQGRYTIIELVGKGGMGSVYKATDTQANDRLVAVKELSQGHHRSKSKLREAQELFRHEARMLHKLAHPNLPRVYASFSENGRSYLVMDFIEGKTLQQLLMESATRTLSVEDILHYAVQLCDVLSYLHQQTPPIIFRDLKPANVMVTAKGRIYLIDFGIVRVFKQDTDSDTQHLGTPGFASPEQHGDGQSGPRSDLYSLGATLHCCLTGKAPRANKPTLFDFTPAHTINPQIPQNLSELIQRLVAHKEDQRPKTAEEVKKELLAIQKPHSNLLARLYYKYEEISAHVAHFDPQGKHRFSAGLSGWLIESLSPIFKPSSAKSLPNLQNSSSNSQGPSLLRSLLTPYFIFLFSFLGIALIGGSTAMLALNYPTSLVTFYLCLFLLLLLGGIYRNRHIHHPLAHSIMISMSLFLLVIILTLFAQPDVQSFVTAITFKQLLSIGIFGLITIATIRPPKQMAWIDHLCLAVILGTYALFLGNKGVPTLTQFLSIPPKNAQATNSLIIFIIYLFTFVQLIRCKREFPWSKRFYGDRLQILIVALITALLQIVYGVQEIQQSSMLSLHYPLTIDDSFNMISWNIFLIGAPLIATLLQLFMPIWRSYLRRIALFLLGSACIGLQSILGPEVQMPLPKSALQPFAQSLAPILHSNQLAAYGMIIIAGILIYRWAKPFSWLDYISLFSIAIVAVSLQSTAWMNEGPTSPALQPSQIYLIIINKLVLQIFTYLLIISLTMTISSIIMHLARDFQLIDRIMMSINKRLLFLYHIVRPLHHLILLMTTITCAFLLWLRGSSIAHLTPKSSLSLLAPILATILLLCSIIAITRVPRLFHPIDRTLMIFSSLASALLLWSGYTEPSGGLLNDWLTDPQISWPSAGIALGFIAIVLICSMWTRRSFPKIYCDMLKFGFGFSLICALLQWLTPIFLIASLISLIMNILLAVQIEQS